MTDTRAYYASLVADPETPNVIGTYTDKDGNVVVLVLDDAPEILAPFAQDGVIFVKSPRFEAYENHTTRRRPAPGGVSTGHYAITAGTIGLVVRDQVAGDTCVLSNNHVYANINKGKIGDPLLQPGNADGGSNPSDMIARLLRFVKLNRTGGRNTVDAAIGRVTDPDIVSLNILELGYCYGLGDPYLGEQVWKSGRTSALTRGEVVAVDATIEVWYGPDDPIIFEDCIVTPTYSAPGDSGSSILDFSSCQVVGLLFAGNGVVTIACKARNVFEALEIETITPPEVIRSQWLDLSHWQGKVNFETIKSRGVRGVILKICQPPTLIDGKFAEYYDKARAAGLLVGAYIFVDPAYTAMQHYSLFLQAIGDRKLDLPPAMDCETSGASQQVITACIQQLSEMLGQWYGSLPMIYTNKSWWDTNVLPWSGWANHPLWIAYWSNVSYYPAKPVAWQDAHPILWQHEVNENGPWFGVESKGVDNNLSFRGLEDLLGEPPPPPDYATLTITIQGSGSVSPGSGQYPRGETVMLQATAASGWEFVEWSGDASGVFNPVAVLMDTDKHVTAAFAQTGGGGPAVYEHFKGRVMMPRGINIRSGPGTNYADIGDLPLNAVVEILDTAKDGAGNTWARIGYSQWAAQYYNNTEYIRYIMADE